MEDQNKKAVGPVTQGGSVAQPGAPVMPGFEEPIDQRDLIIPVVKLFQGTPTEQDAYPDAKGGQLLNSLTQEVLGAEFIPCFKWTEYAKFNGRNQKDADFNPDFEPGAIIWKTTTPTPEQAEECEFGPNGEKPKANRSMCFLCYFVGQPMPLVLRFSKTSFGAGKRLLSLAKFVNMPMYSRKYKLSTKKDQDDAGNIYHVMQVALVGNAAPEEVAQAQRWYDDFKGKALKVHDEEAAEGAKKPGDVGWEE